MVALDLVAAVIQAMAAVMAAVAPATAAAVQEAILAPAVMAIRQGPAAVQEAAAHIPAPMGIPAVAVQDRLVKDLVALMPLTVVGKVVVAAKAVVVVKILG